MLSSTNLSFANVVKGTEPQWGRSINMNDFNQVVETIKSNDLMVIDNHRRGTGAKCKIDTIVLFADGEIGGLEAGTLACLNAVYVDEDGDPRLSTRSINAPLYRGEDLQDYLQNERIKSILHIDAEGQEWTYHK